MDHLREVKGNNECSLQQKMQEAEEKVTSLQEVIKKLQMTKKCLHLNAVEVKASIHSNISRLLESMRNREVWLLNQVDLILEAKETGLRHQEDQLNHAIGQLSNCLNLMDSGAALNNELNDLLRKIDSIEKHPVESPHISFRADIGSLRQAILEFGRVDSKRLPLEAFASPHLRSSSLPKPFEDYEDDEHHVFHKSVHEIHEKKHGKSIVFNIPKLLPDIPSWVSPTHMTTEKAAVNQFLSSTELSASTKSRPTTLMKNDFKKPTTAFSVSQWMQEIKMEDEEDELIVPQLSSRFGNKGIVTSASASCLLTSGPASQVFPKSSPAVGETTIGSDKSCSNCFSFQSPHLKHWLIDGESRLPSKTKISETQGCVVPFEPCVFKPSANIKENVLESCMKKIAALPADSWLAPSAESLKLESEGGSGLLENYAKRIALLPWLISYRGLAAKEPEQELRSETGTRIIETYARRIANLKWLASETNVPETERVKEPKTKDHQDSESSWELIPNEDGGILERYARKLDSKPWLLKNEKEQEHAPENNKAFLSEHLVKISQLPLESWLLPDQPSCESLPLTSGTVPSDHSEDCLSYKEEKSNSNSTKDAHPADLDKYYNALNALPLEHWLLSMPAESVSKPKDVD